MSEKMPINVVLAYRKSSNVGGVAHVLDECIDVSAGCKE